MPPRCTSLHLYAALDAYIPLRCYKYNILATQKHLAVQVGEEGAGVRKASLTVVQGGEEVTQARADALLLFLCGNTADHTLC